MPAQDQLTVTEFRDVVLRSFAFLRDQYGFRLVSAEFSRLAPGTTSHPIPLDAVAEARLGDGIVSIRFESANVAVEVSDDPRYETTCQLFQLEKPEKSRVDLWHVRSFTGVGAQPLPEWGRTSIQEILTKKANALALSGDPWLRGDSRAWDALLEWWATGMPPSAPRA